MVFSDSLFLFVLSGGSPDRGSVCSGFVVLPGETHMKDKVTPPNSVSWFYSVSRIYCLVRGEALSPPACLPILI